MNAIGLREAKTRLSEICGNVAAKGETIIVTRRGKPLVRIVPIASTRAKVSIWDRRVQYEKKYGQLTEEFELSAREKQKWRSSLEE